MTNLIDRLFPAPAPHLRDARPQDAARLAELHAAAFRRGWGQDEFERLLSERAVRAHVVSEGPRGQLLGFVISHMVPPEAEVLSIAVLGDRRGQGFGRMLLKHHLSRLASEGVTTSFLEVDETNVAAVRLYDAFGYEVVGRRRGYYAEGAADALMLRRDF